MKVLDGDVCLSTVRSDAHHARSARMRFFQILDGAQAWQQKCSDLSVACFIDGRFNQIQVRDFRKAIIER